MTTVTGGTADRLDLDDAAGLVAADTGGLLRGAASAGAQVRATAAAVEEGGLDGLAGHTPRSVVLVGGRGPARHAAAVLQELAAHTTAVPVLQASTAPRWLGALDLVVVFADDPGDVELAASVARAANRGADVILATPAEGPLADAAGGRALRLPPRVVVPDGMGFVRFVAVGLAALGGLGVLPSVDLAALADVLDTEVERDHPDRELFASPAKALATRMLGRELVFAGAGAATTLLAAHASRCLLRHAGVSAAATDLSELLAAAGRPDRPGDGARLDPLFHDPEIDGPRHGQPMRAVLLATAAERGAAVLRARVLPDVELQHADEAVDEQPCGVAAELVVLAARVETAAVYLSLAG